MLSKQHIIRITVSDWVPVFLLLKVIPLTHSYDSLHKTIPTQKLLYKWRINKEKKNTLTVATKHLTGGGVN